MFTIIITLIFLRSGACQMLGPADFTYHSSEKCPDAPTGIRVELTGRRLNRTSFGLTLDLDTPFDFDENLGAELMGSKKMDGGYKPGMSVYNFSNTCAAIEKMTGEIFEDIKKQANIDGCPIPKGHYLLKDYVMNNDHFQVPKVYGDFRMQIKLLHQGVPQSCLLVYYELTPKNKFLG